MAGGCLAVTHLVERGCRRIAFVGGPLNVLQVADRLQGAHQAVEQHRGGQLEVLSPSGRTVENGRSVGAALVDRPAHERPDGIFTANDLLAVGLLHAFTTSTEMSVPDNIALLGYDDIDFASPALVPLSSVRQPSALIGRTAVDLLLAEVAGVEAGSPYEPQQVVFQPELVVRASSLRPAP